MSTLASLKLSNARKPTQQPTAVLQRNKLAARVFDQLELARAQQAGGTYTSRKLRTLKDLDGVTKTLEVNCRVRPWWFRSETGRLCLHIRYGSQKLELQKGKSTIELNDHQDLLRVLELLKVAVLNGELDAQIAAASQSLKSGFAK